MGLHIQSALSELGLYCMPVVVELCVLNKMFIPQLHSMYFTKAKIWCTPRLRPLRTGSYCMPVRKIYDPSKMITFQLSVSIAQEYGNVKCLMQHVSTH